MEETLGRSGGKTGGTVSRLGEGRSISRRSCRLKKGGVEKKEAGREEGEGRSKEDWAVVADEVEADVSSERSARLVRCLIFGNKQDLVYLFLVIIRKSINKHRLCRWPFGDLSNSVTWRGHFIKLPSVVCPSERRSSEIARLGSAFSRRRPKSFAASKDLWLFKYLALLRQNLQRPGFLPG